ncbi:hypothetical protein [Streptoalloteichus tenebrarius]|uniref:hypothetical protein n=1 Tax=Streptoalloteichus tenebrarius (strain ATCC 17920 / DSM 40477 / JCM 4838 / CBS 697.72 / NBRC 16177 / NCIMB 11028 / NRRL B-12390 / A12253. 1 / ISP 5477) TaxID=1933 RepID=UPI0020A5FD15|nr:hypothetical protein [Streptoalloteichus tenebrarius]
MVAPGGSLVAARSGWRPGPGQPGRVTASSPTPDGRVTVAAFQRINTPSRSAAPYIQTLDAPKVIDILGAAPPHSSLGRHDLIVVQQNDQLHSDPNNALLVRHVVGTPSATPQDPDPAAGGASTDYVPLARIRVPAGATAITNDRLDDLRPPAMTVALGGVLPVASQAERDAIVSPYEGMAVWRRDKDWLEVRAFDGWRVQGIAVVATAAGLSAITTPYQGQVVYRADSGEHYWWNSTTWVPLRQVTGRIVARPGALVSNVGTTETNIPPLAVEGVRILLNRIYGITVTLLGGFTAAAGDSFGIRVRRDNPTSGLVVAEWTWLPTAVGLDDYRTVSAPWRSDVSDSAARFYVTVTKLAGTGTATIYGNGRSSIRIEDVGGDPALWKVIT